MTDLNRQSAGRKGGRARRQLLPRCDYCGKYPAYDSTKVHPCSAAKSDAAARTKAAIVERVRHATDVDYSDGDGLRNIDSRGLEALAAEIEGMEIL